MSPIDQRTCDNPESAMVHNTQRGISQTLTPEDLRHQQQWVSQQNAYIQQLSGIPSVLCGADENAPKIEPSGKCAPNCEIFDSEAHRAFMRSLG